MKQLKACVWVGPSRKHLEQSITSSQIETYVPENVNAVFQSEGLGVWTIFSSISEAITFSYAVLDPTEESRHSVLITAGELELKEGKWSGWTLDIHQTLTPFLEPRQIWFTEAIFNLIDVDALSWEEVGATSTGSAEIRCFRLVNSGQVFVPSAFKRSLREQKVIVCQKHRQMGPVEKGKHVVFVGFSYGVELRAQVTRVNSVIPNDRLWLVVPKLSMAERKEWIELGRHLIVAEHGAFLKDIFRQNLTLIDMGENATLFLDPVKLSSGELSIFGVALPQVPMARTIDGYTLDLLTDGSWGHGAEEEVTVRVAININGHFISALKPGCRMNSSEMEIGKSYPLGNGTRLTIGRVVHRYIANVGKPYCGLFLGHPTKRMAVSIGDRIEIGRQPTGGGFSLPDRGGTDRIQWGNSVQAEKAKQTQLTLDRALTGRHHGVLTVESTGRFGIVPLHDKLPTFVLPQASQRLQRVTNEVLLRDEGLIIVGTNVLKIAKTQ